MPGYVEVALLIYPQPGSISPDVDAVTGKDTVTMFAPVPDPVTANLTTTVTIFPTCVYFA
jgi:hypothetical protein